MVLDDKSGGDAPNTSNVSYIESINSYKTRENYEKVCHPKESVKGDEQVEKNLQNNFQGEEPENEVSVERPANADVPTSNPSPETNAIIVQSDQPSLCEKTSPRALSKEKGHIHLDDFSLSESTFNNLCNDILKRLEDYQPLSEVFIETLFSLYIVVDSIKEDSSLIFLDDSSSNRANIRKFVYDCIPLSVEILLNHYSF